jgi:hypothetical protein
MAERIPGYLFDRRDYKLLSIVNEVIGFGKANPYPRGELYTHFHPEGIKELAESRGLRIAYATILLLQSLTTGRVEDRLGALRALRNEVIDIAIGPMPHNTARVLLQIMKELVRAHGNEHRQLELAHDFRAAASGKPRIVRRELRKYHLLEMPEEWNQVSFDDHVHDANTKGRKTPTHLIMDAWIKGIRRLRVIYYNHISSRSATELMQAAAIMEITLRIGIEFPARFRGKYAQVIWVPRGFPDDQSFLCFLAEPETAALMEQGRKVSYYQEEYIYALLRAFNARHRVALRDDFGIDLSELDEVDFKAYVAPGQASLLHLAKFIHTKVAARVALMGETMHRSLAAAVDAEERRAIRTQIETVEQLSAEKIMDLYLRHARNPEIADVTIPRDDPSVPSLLCLTPKEVLDRLFTLHSGHRVTLNLSNLQVEDVLEILYDCEGRVTRLEIFNLKDYAAGIMDHIPPILELQQAINEGSVVKLKRIIRETIARLSAQENPDRSRIERLTAILHDIISLKAFYAGTRLKARIGSDSTGGSPHSHGMGLVVDETLPGRARREIRRNVGKRLRLPLAVSVAPRITYRQPQVAHGLDRLAAALRRIPGLGKVGLRREKSWEFSEYETALVPVGNIVTLGGMQGSAENGLRSRQAPANGTERSRRPYLNSLLKNSFKVIGGFIPAFITFALTKDWWLLAYGGAFIWFGITGLRNILQSVLGGGGLRRSPMLRWNDLISWERISDSLLYTGFSVPLLDYLTKTVILDRGFGITTSTQPALLYVFMALANGLYLAGHNIFRGLPKAAVVGNLFRSVASIPIAIGFNAALGGLFGYLGIVGGAEILQKWAAVISKTASDIMAGIIEGLADRYQNIARRRKAIGHVFDQILEAFAELEIVLPETQVLEYIQAPDRHPTNVSADALDLIKRMYVHALDLLYFWMYQPRSRIAMRVMLRELSPEESRIILQTQSVLVRQRSVSLLFIEGILGQGFSRPLAFYLSHSPNYLNSMQELLREQSERRPEADRVRPTLTLAANGAGKPPGAAAAKSTLRCPR